MIQIVLLTHEREIARPTNTGQLALKGFPQYCRRIIWSRTAADNELKQACESQQALLLFPETQQDPLHEREQPQSQPQSPTDPQLLSNKQIIILDATWQEARKMVRQSPYLQQAQRYSLQGQSSSQYQLRRNQLTDGLCTLECVQALFTQLNMNQQAEQLQQVFQLFNQKK
ncbi:tRNA-uridine aminocarboxypropyltransferase [Shewanella sp. Isolate11]|uniref:DTW domain-containing protein n=1 Tax=Shewanella sp. Isolate11 TaxID=2908530 RepID=UPI001EFCFBDA|nr:tRNA-uridine aminocarboxypropyltransferase [Shewanella sp. Isolate11]MCG9696556.1 DTW domain-containing protein [Shewanella sp. Isolate11]